MQTETKKTPTLRFPEFNGDWETKKLKEVTSYIDYRGKTPPKSDSGVFLVTAKNVKFGYIDYECSKEYIPVELYEEVMRRGKPVIGDVLITTEAPLGNVASIDKEYVALAQRVIKLRGKKELSNLFLKHRLMSPKFQKVLLKHSTGSTAKGIKGSILHKLAFVFPEKKEQEKIASFLTSIDKKIEQLTKKKDLLEKYKKGVMQKIFNQEIRFKDENREDFADWEVKNLGKIGEIVGGGTPPTEKPEFWNGDINWFTPTEIKQKYIQSSNRKITSNGLKSSSAKLLPIGTLLLTSRATIGDIGISTIECSTNQGFQSIIVNEKNNNEFLYYWIIQNKKEFIKKANGSTFLEISKNEISKLKIYKPSLKEQQKIADFLSTIDDKINLVNQELEKTQEYKKGLLQKMFV